MCIVREFMDESWVFVLILTEILAEIEFLSYEWRRLWLEIIWGKESKFMNTELALGGGRMKTWAWSAEETKGLCFREKKKELYLYIFYLCSITVVSSFPPLLSSAPHTHHLHTQSSPAWLSLSMGSLYTFLDIEIKNKLTVTRREGEGDNQGKKGKCHPKRSFRAMSHLRDKS